MEISVILLWVLLTWVSVYAASYGVYLCRHKHAANGVLVFLLVISSVLMAVWRSFQ